MKEKLAPRYVGPYQICQRVGKLAYELELPEELTEVHPVFHVSQLCKCLNLPDEQVPTEALDILDRAKKETRSMIIPMCKVQWSNHTKWEATWEKELELWMLYPYLFERYVSP